MIGYAYDDRWDRMTVGGFFKRRLVRLHPMVVAGNVIGAVLFSIPQIGGKPCFADGLYQAVAIIVIFPLVVLLGAGSVTSGTFSTKACKFLGELSYPLYITHYPFMYMQMAWVEKHPDVALWQHIILNAGVVTISIILAWCVYKVYDLPVREWLTDKYLKKVAHKEKL